MTQKNSSIARRALTIIVTALSFASGAVAAGTYTTVSPGDDLQRADDHPRMVVYQARAASRR